MKLFEIILFLPLIIIGGICILAVGMILVSIVQDQGWYGMGLIIFSFWLTIGCLYMISGNHDGY